MARDRRHWLCGENSRLLAGGRVLNPQGRRDAIACGRSNWIEGELLVFGHAGRIRLGDYCYVGRDTRIWSAADISIGDRVFIAHNVNVHDNDAHSLSAAERHKHYRQLTEQGRADFNEDTKSAPIVIEDDAWIGFNSTILKGVRIGRGAVVGACSLVKRDVAPYTVVAGNPAVPIGEAKP